ncbi:hypothetical protein ALC60_13778, partial [Trachymyrmex zeteki]
NSLGIKHKLPSLVSVIMDFDILCIQETLLKSNNNFSVNRFKIVRSDGFESDSFGSDHFPVITTVGIQVNFKLRFYYKLSLTKEMYQDFHHELFLSTKNLPRQVEHDVIGCYEEFAKDLIETARSFFPEGKHYPCTARQIKKLEPPPWWNEACSKAMHKEEGY